MDDFRVGDLVEWRPPMDAMPFLAVLRREHGEGPFRVAEVEAYGEINSLVALTGPGGEALWRAPGEALRVTERYLRRRPQADRENSEEGAA